ncbi:MAG TPA: hypothetical protein DHW44_13740 [Odoribacter splanchnicus]|jgi:hypothetical protein|nr:hypothetical protein [Odoribacter splanchnicus]
MTINLITPDTFAYKDTDFSAISYFKNKGATLEVKFLTSKIAPFLALSLALIAFSLKLFYYPLAFSF